MKVRYSRTGRGIPANETARADFAAALKHHMEKAGMNQSEFARACAKQAKGAYGYTRFAISRWARGHRMPNLANLSILCATLGVKVEALFPSINPRDKQAVLTSRQVEKAGGYPKHSRDGIGRVRKIKKVKP